MDEPGPLENVSSTVSSLTYVRAVRACAVRGTTYLKRGVVRCKRRIWRNETRRECRYIYSVEIWIGKHYIYMR